MWYVFYSAYKEYTDLFSSEEHLSPFSTHLFKKQSETPFLSHQRFRLVYFLMQQVGYEKQRFHSIHHMGLSVKGSTAKASA